MVRFSKAKFYILYVGLVLFFATATFISLVFLLAAMLGV